MAGWGVRKLVLFGSFLDPNIERVGDVDLAVEMVPLRQPTKDSLTPSCAAGYTVVGRCNRVSPCCRSM